MKDNPIQVVLSRLSHRRRGKRMWMANCPAHADDDPSLAVNVTQDGIVLLKCFAGCDTADVLAAIGIDFPDLFPDELKERGKRPTQEMVDRWIVRMGARKLKKGKLNEVDHQAMLNAMDRLDRGRYED